MTAGLVTPVAARPTVLLVDDDPLALRAMGQLLGKLGYDALCVTRAAEALTLLSLRSFHAVVSDLRQPMASGGVFANHVGALAPELPLIIVTGSEDLREVSGLLNGTRVDGILVKGGPPRELAAALDRAVGAAAGKACADRTARTIAMGLVRALALRDSETEGHSRRVAAWTLMLAQRTGAPPEDWSRIELGALLHDLGKIGVADAILHKPGKLTDEEWVEMRRHPEHGCNLLSGIPALASATDIVRSHHERWDGGGYPDGLAGEAIPRYARLFALVDAYDALTADRAYRQGRSHAVAAEILVADRGAQFDPAVVDAFLAVPVPDWVSVARTFADHPATTG